MKSKAPLALMEQMVMLLIFALAAALCLQAFVKSDKISLRSEAKSRAALAAQDIAEILRHDGRDMESVLSYAEEVLGGNYTGDKLCIYYDENWNITQEEGAYCLSVQEVAVEEQDLQKASVQVKSREPEKEELLFELEAAWLEVSPNE